MHNNLYPETFIGPGPVPVRMRYKRNSIANSYMPTSRTLHATDRYKERVCT